MRMRKRLMWSPKEDEALKRYVEKHGHGNWNEVARLSGVQPQRCPKSCRLRWVNYLRPGLKRGPFSPQETRLLLSLHRHLGNRWSQIAAYLPGRSDNDVKNFWHTTARKRCCSLHQLVGDAHEYTSERNPDLATTTVQNHSSLESAGPNMVDPHLEGNSSDSSHGTIAVGAAPPGSPTSAAPAPASSFMSPDDEPPPEGLHLVVWSFMNRKFASLSSLNIV